MAAKAVMSGTRWLTCVLAGNRQHSQRDAREHQQSVPTRREPQLAARQDGQSRRVGTGLQEGGEPREETVLVEGYEDENVFDSGHCYPARCHYRSFWYVSCPSRR